MLNQLVCLFSRQLRDKYCIYKLKKKLTYLKQVQRLPALKPTRFFFLVDQSALLLKENLYPD